MASNITCFVLERIAGVKLADARMAWQSKNSLQLNRIASAVLTVFYGISRPLNSAFFIVKSQLYNPPKM